MNVSKEIGLKLVVSVLSPFLCMGFISENFNWEGKIPDESTCYIGTLEEM